MTLAIEGSFNVRCPEGPKGCYDFYVSSRCRHLEVEIGGRYQQARPYPQPIIQDPYAPYRDPLAVEVAPPVPANERAGEVKEEAAEVKTKASLDDAFVKEE